jgi:hypothetical protein
VQFLEQKHLQSGVAGRRGEEIDKGRRQPGSARGQVWTAPDFDAPLDDFKEYQ